MYNKDILAYKGFNKDLKCKGYQFEVGKTFEHDGEVIVCESGFHACKNPLDVLSHYPIMGSRFAVVKCSGEISEQEDVDSKIACRKLFVKEEIKLPELIKKGIDWVLCKVELNDKKSKNTNRSTSVTTGYSSTSVATGNWSTSVATGDWSTSVTTGYRSTSAAAGYSSTSAATGYSSTSVTTGNWSTSATTGDRSTSVTEGDWSTSVTTGYRSTSAATGYSSTSVATGNWSTSVTTGDWSTSVTEGDWSTSVATGRNSTAEVSGDHSVAISLGSSLKARAGKNGAIVCVYVDNNTKALVHIKASKVGENGIKPDTWYALDSNGNFIEVE